MISKKTQYRNTQLSSYFIEVENDQAKVCNKHYIDRVCPIFKLYPILKLAIQKHAIESQMYEF